MTKNIDLHTQLVLKLLNGLNSKPIDGKIKFQKIAIELKTALHIAGPILYPDPSVYNLFFGSVLLCEATI